MKRLFYTAVAALILVSCSQHRFPAVAQDGRIAVVAHRGFWQNEEAGMTRNSVASLNQAIRHGFAGSECDIHLTLDSVAVVCHDNNIGGMTIWNSTYEQLLAARLDNGERIPTFDEYLDAYAKGSDITRLVVEFKAQEDFEHEMLLVDKAFSSLKAHRLFNPEKVAFISFSHDICLKVAEEAPRFVNQYLQGDVAPATLAAEGINGIDYHHAVLREHPFWVDEAHSLGMSVNVWTVNDTEDIDYFITLGVDAITTDNPILVRQRLGEREYRKQPVE